MSLHAEAALRTESLWKVFPSRFPHRKEASLVALRNVNVQLACGQRVALMGRSGAGKSTLARCLCGHESPTSGAVWHGAQRLAPGVPSPETQLIFPDTPLALQPHWTVGRSVMEPLWLAGLRDRIVLRQTARHLLERVGLSAQYDSRLPSELSGGQRQRVALARALGTSWLRTLVLDEPFSSLDPESRSGLASLLLALQQERRIALLLITHDLTFVQALAEEVWVMQDGQIVEQSEMAAFLRNPCHPASRELWEASRALSHKGESPQSQL